MVIPFSNNIVKEYLDHNTNMMLMDNVKTKTSQGDLNLEWDVYGRMIKSRNSQYTAEYRYDALAAVFKSGVNITIQVKSRNHLWMGWQYTAYESNEQITKHYIYEKDSFVPLHRRFMQKK
ncbi:hypothetical protein IDM30_07155 [Acinetobacter seifertii]|nr:hypothetical protein [Acinetobacter seifertii]